MRTELLGQIVGAQFELERALIELPPNSGSAMAAGNQQLQALKDLQAQIGTAGPKDLHAMRAAIVAAVAGAQMAIQQGHAAANQPDPVLLAEIARASREQVHSVMAGMKDFDKYLQFGPGDTEADYRQRAAERRADIEAQQAKHTPQGDLNAAGGVMGQMVDAKAHGAGDSPEFQQRWTELEATTEKLRDTIRHSGGSTKEFDDRLRDDLRRIMKSKGLNDVQIDAQFAVHPNPLEAAKAYVDSGNVTAIDRAAKRAGKRTLENGAAAADAEETNAKLTATDPMAEFRAAGVSIAEQIPDTPFAHGIAEQKSGKTKIATL